MKSFYLYVGLGIFCLAYEAYQGYQYGLYSYFLMIYIVEFLRSQYPLMTLL
jgi:hypothetical protein